MVWSVITNPNRFFRQRTGDLSLVPPAVIVFIAGLASVLSTLVLLLAVPGAGSKMGVGAFVVLSTLFNAPIAFGWILVQWLVYTAVFHALAHILSGEGSIRETVIVTGWGFLPVIVLSLFNPVIRYVAYGSGGGVVQFGVLRGVQQSVSGRTALFLALVSIVFTLWQGIIWTAGIRETHQLTVRRAVAVVGIPLGLLMMWTVVGAVLSTSSL